MLGADKPATKTATAERLVVVRLMVQSLRAPICHNVAQLNATPDDALVWCTGAACHEKETYT